MTKTQGFLGWIERVGNRLPDPATIFAIGAVLVLVGSDLAARFDWQVENPVTGQIETARSLLSSDGMQWAWRHVVVNFTSFAPLGMVLVAMLGIGVAEHTGLIGAGLKALVLVMPQRLLTPTVLFTGVLSSAALDAGYVILPPLAAALFAKANRSPLVGLAAVFAGVAAGFSANLIITGLDPLLQGFTQSAAQILLPEYVVDIRCNYYFMIVSTFMVVGVGWGTTRVVERRFSAADVQQQITAGQQDVAAEAQGANAEQITPAERRGLMAAGGALVLVALFVLAMIVPAGAPLHGNVELPGGRSSPIWAEVIVPIVFIAFLVPAVVFGAVTGSLASDKDVAAMMGRTMSTMGPYIVLAFFAAQFISWFAESNLGRLLALESIAILQRLPLPSWLLITVFVLLAATLNLMIGSASAKWALMSTVFVPIFAGLGISPELTQAAYRVGDSVTNIIAPLNPYLVIVLVFLRRYQPSAGIGTLISLMLPYTCALLVAWVALLLIWMTLGIPLGPGGPLYVQPVGS